MVIAMETLKDCSLVTTGQVLFNVAVVTIAMATLVPAVYHFISSARMEPYLMPIRKDACIDNILYCFKCICFVVYHTDVKRLGRKYIFIILNKEIYFVAYTAGVFLNCDMPLNTATHSDVLCILKLLYFGNNAFHVINS